ncbi:unnamed protein product [Symbiodinium microadriaticum]|nr:unnamed protein product [Symbiodinium microadriaticum]
MSNTSQLHLHYDELPDDASSWSSAFDPPKDLPKTKKDKSAQSTKQKKGSKKKTKRQKAKKSKKKEKTSVPSATTESEAASEAHSSATMGDPMMFHRPRFPRMLRNTFSFPQGGERRGHRPVLDTCANEAIPRWGKGGLINHLNAAGVASPSDGMSQGVHLARDGMMFDTSATYVDVKVFNGNEADQPEPVTDANTLFNRLHGTDSHAIEGGDLPAGKKKKRLLNTAKEDDKKKIAKEWKLIADAAKKVQGARRRRSFNSSLGRISGDGSADDVSDLAALARCSTSTAKLLISEVVLYLRAPTVTVALPASDKQRATSGPGRSWHSQGQHRDSGNEEMPNVILTVSPFAGGELWIVVDVDSCGRSPVYKAIAADPADVAARRQSLLDHGARRAHEPVSLLRGVPDDHPLEMGVSLWVPVVGDIASSHRWLPEGATLGPFFDIDEVSEEIRTGSRPTIRGRAEAQRSRGRQCHLQWDQHMATVVTEKLQLPSTDTNVAAIKWLRSRLPDAPLRGWVLDERRAYWQIPTAPSHRKWSVVASSVFNFVMVGHSVFIVEAFNFYDDKYGFEPEIKKSRKQEAFEEISTILEQEELSPGQASSCSAPRSGWAFQPSPIASVAVLALQVSVAGDARAPSAMPSFGAPESGGGDLHRWFGSVFEPTGKGAGKLDKRPREPNTAPQRGRQIMGDLPRLLDSGSMGIINQLMLTTATWRKQRSKNECTCGLRQALMGAMLMELEARMAKLATDTTAQTPLVRAKILLQDTRWNQEKQSHEPTNGTPLSHETALTALRELKSLILQEGTMHAFHAMGGMSEGKEGVTLFKLTLSMEAPAKVTIREILTQFTESSMLRLIGARLRPERSHRPLPKELQQLLRPEQ